MLPPNSATERAQNHSSLKGKYPQKIKTDEIENDFLPSLPLIT